MGSFTPNGTLGRLQIMPGTCELDKPEKILTKPPGICGEWLKRATEEYESKSWGGKQLAVGLVAGKTKTKDMENAEDFKRNCDILPDEISEKYIDNLRQQLTDYVNGKARWMAPEHALGLRAAVPFLENIYYTDPSVTASVTASPQPLTEAENEWLAKQQNDIEMPFMGMFAGPGFIARFFGASEQRVREVNELIGLSMFDILTTHMAAMEWRNPVRGLSERPMQGINIGGGGAKVSYRTLHLPQGVALNEFYDFANKLRGLLREKGIPDGKIYIHGSRANGMASSGESDIDIMVVISDAEFDALAAK
ncbi:nucleotidyltransferase domain-containing protein [Salmonella enterica]|nr:nucleotidyltransferase domain-containing protein [Salmonella enterica]